MKCEDAELALCELPQSRSAELTSHLSTCASCQQTAQVLSLATLPEPTALERAMGSQVPVKTHLAWRAQEARRFSVQRFAGYALAAGVGALIASGGWLSVRPAAVSQLPAVMQQGTQVSVTDPDWDTSEEGLSPDEDAAAFFEVSWPTLTEGEEQ
jgi:hypothetical protein